ncbi:MAG: M12 family metallo-peptidase [Phycisphaerales bacterium]|nr:M12 family metallo-peptidase [Phycisphaerales bacterium]
MNREHQSTRGRCPSRFIGGIVGLSMMMAGGVMAAPGGGDDFDNGVSINEVNGTFGLFWSTIQMVGVNEEQGDGLSLEVDLDGRPHRVMLNLKSVRSAGYQLMEQRDDGELYEVEPGPVNTYRGSIVGQGGSRVAGSILENGLTVTIRMSDGSQWYMEPLLNRVRGAGPDHYVVYPQAAIDSPLRTCGTTEFEHGVVPELAGHGTTPPVRGGTLWEAELACDADFEYFQDYGSTSAVENRINSVINSVNVQYESEVSITHTIVTILVRSSSNDPYSGDISNRLDQVRNQWNSNHSNIQRDVVELFMGDTGGSGVIGIAWLDAICTSFGYNVVMSDCCGSFGCATDLTAHELGHNWGAGHCNCSGNTMNPSITCSNDFSNQSINSITSYRNSILFCLEEAGDPTGACCISGSCSIVTSLDCSASGGSYLGDDSDCSGDPCFVPADGACCVEGSCSIGTEADCNAAGGTYQGDDTNCSGDPCFIPPPTGGCCVGISCSVVTGDDCVASGGNYLGDGSTCGGFPCSPDGVSVAHAVVGSNRIDDPEFNWTVDVYISLPAGNRVDAVAGNSGTQKLITSSGLFYQDDFGGPMSTDINPAFYEFAPGLEWDSRVTIGAIDSTGAPFASNELGSVGIDWTDFENGLGLAVDNGLWYILPSEEQGEAQAFTGTDCQERNGVLVARLTTFGESSVIQFEGLVQGSDASGESWQETVDLSFGYTETLDCNLNGVSDTCDIANGSSSDSNGNGVPDECESGCAGDYDGNGQTNIDDILTVIGDWGNPYTVEDLLAVLDDYGCSG